MKNFNFKIDLKKVRYLFHDIGSDADKDWKIVLVGSILILVSLFAFHIHTFYDVQGVKREGNEIDGAATQLINARAFEDVLALYDERSEAFNAMAVQEFTFVDPAR